MQNKRVQSPELTGERGSAERDLAATPMLTVQTNYNETCYSSFNADRDLVATHMLTVQTNYKETRYSFLNAERELSQA